MIARILTSSNSFAGVDYNEKKVNKGSAELIEMSNFGYIQDMKDFSASQYKKYLIDYSAKNTRIKNTQFHVAISCKGKSYSKESLLEIAHQYLKGMGYEGNPSLIYFHSDTDNNHLHIITSRIDSKGIKIYDSNERIRSQEIIAKIMKENPKEDCQKAFTIALKYNYENINQFKAILESQGYECFEKDDFFNVKKGGIVLLKKEVNTINKEYKISEEQKSRQRQLRAIFLKYKDFATNMKEYKELMKSKFGLDLLFFGIENNPYGYMVVDHLTKNVFRGKDIIPVKTLIQFQTKEEQLKNINDFIYVHLETDNKLTTWCLNKKLKKKFNVAISQGKIMVGDNSMSIDRNIAGALKYNDKIFYINKFEPKNEIERNVLANLYKVNASDIKLCNSMKANVSYYKEIASAIIKDSQNPRVDFEANGLNVISFANNYFLLDKDNKELYSFEELSIDRNIFTNEGITHNNILNEIAGILNVGGQAGGGDNSVKKKKKKRNM